MKASSIDLPFDGSRRAYDRDRLATAVLVYMEAIGQQPGLPTIHHTKFVSQTLRDEHGFATDSIAYAIGARICVENDIEP